MMYLTRAPALRELKQKDYHGLLAFVMYLTRAAGIETQEAP